MATQLNASQVHILQTLAKAPDGMTRTQLETKAPDGTAVTPDNLGTVKASGNHDGSLKALGLVKTVAPDVDLDAEGPGRDPVLWLVTAKGLKVAVKMLARKRGNRIDHGVIDTAVKKVKANRVHSIDTFTDSDFREVKTLLGEEYADVTLEEVRRQTINRRKQGAYSDPLNKVRMAAAETIRRCGPGGTLIPDLLTEKQLKELEKLLA